jgi:hypothetical protein
MFECRRVGGRVREGGGVESITYPILTVAMAVINYPYPTDPVSQSRPPLFI